MRGLLVAGSLLLASLAGCISGPSLEGSSTGLAADPALLPVELLEEGGFAIDVPLEVYLVGFDAATAESIRASLEPTAIDHSAGSADRVFPPDPAATAADGLSLRAPTQPRAIFRVVDVDEAFEGAFFAGLTRTATGGLDANAAEASLAAAIGELRGAPLDRMAPVFVVIHGGDALGDHTWRYQFADGWLEGIRVFGELSPLTVFDVSARPDPFVVAPRRSPEALVFGTAFGFSQPADYDWILEPSGEKTVTALTQLIVDAAHWRFLKGPSYPISTRPCHHVTLLLAVHTTSLTETLPGYLRAENAIDVPGLASAFRNLTGEEVIVDLKVLRLPQDDPVLDALARGGGTLVGLDLLRWHLDENFERYVDVAQGCEEYLSLLLWGDASAAALTGGIALYDVQRGHRLSFSFVNDEKRIRELYEGPGDFLVNERNASRERWNWATMLFAHETGHLFGQQHPQHVSRTEDGLGTKHSFEAVYSIMGYQQDDRMIDFGSVDRSTWAMGRAGYAIAEAQALDLAGTPAFEGALASLRQRQWDAAYEALEDELARAGAEDAATLPGFHFVERHAHERG